MTSLRLRIFYDKESLKKQFVPVCRANVDHLAPQLFGSKTQESAMKYLMMVAMVVASFVGTSQAEEVKSGLQVGKSIGPFYVTKTAGAEEDGVKVGANLCYRCKNGSRPQVMVFTRSSDGKVAELVQSLDAELKKNSSKQLRAFVNVLGEERADAEQAAKTLATNSKATNVPFVVPNEVENGPDDYGLNADAEIIMANGGRVKANVAYDKVDEIDVKAVVANLAKILE
jgi:hypothetical protein